MAARDPGENSAVNINLDLELLRTLVAFADTGSFKTAALHVFRSQSAVSMQMKRLEGLTGQTLFERRGREVVLSDAGLTLVVGARRLLAAHDRILEEMRGQEVRGEVRIGMPEDYAPLVLPRMLHGFKEHYPGVSLNILTDTTPILEKKLSGGELDIAILATLAPLASDVTLTRQPIVWVTSRHHDAHVRRPLLLALFSDESPVYQATVAALNAFDTGADDAITFRIAVLSKSSSVLATVAASGFAVATMARGVAPETLRILSEEDGFPDPGHVDIVLRASPDSQSVATAALLNRIVNEFAN